MGMGESELWYTSHGSKRVHHRAIIHSIEGSYTHDPKTGKPSRLKSGGHGQAALTLMQKYGIEFKVLKTFPNGVRVGNVPLHKLSWKRFGMHQTWFPKNWTTRDIVTVRSQQCFRRNNSQDEGGDKRWSQWPYERRLTLTKK